MIETRGTESQSSQDGQLSGRQYLFNIRYSGPQGDGSLRLILRLPGPRLFQLLAADTLGRARWSLELREGRTLLLDHRQKTFCESAGDLSLAEQGLALLPVESLPKLLLGELPVDSVDYDAATDVSEVRESEARRWSLRREDQVLKAWTLWVEDEPTLWWTRQGKGGILSHRDGSQFRWRRVVEEPLASLMPDLERPADYDRVHCDAYDVPELHQDQPAPPGAGSS